MQKWLTTTVVALALACPAGLLRAQQPAPPVAPPQPANNADRAPADDAHADDGAAEAADEAARRVLEQAGQAQRRVDLELRALMERQRAAAEALRGQVQVQGIDGAGGMARVQFAGRARTEKAAWLGVSTSKVPEALRQHLELKHKYIGLVVERVEPESPAAEAGLLQFDIIERVNDQWIVNTEQFSVVLRMHEPGTDVKLGIIRKGKPQDLQVKLAEKELPVLGAAQFEFFGAPQFAEAAQVPVAPQIFEWAPEGRVIIRQPGGIEPLVLDRLKMEQNSQVVLNDPEHSLKITTKKGRRHLQASDANGVVIFEGPINTDEELGEVPEEIRKKIDKLAMPDHAPAAEADARPAPTTTPARARD